ncbi:DUF6046 domain-containing protein [Tenacibaculum maritimum]|nr:DUF6046 domain-containing protein [Tenacibaculum maritimum]MDB0612673.1 DUF6046 domain-containing protein [Tenacibaculum maritimum]
MAKFNLLDAYSEAFGSAYNSVGTVAVVPQESSLVKRETPTLNFDRTSILGTPIHFPMQLDGYELPNEPLVSISGKNRIVKTPVDGQDGTFKELFSRDDYMITIKGIAINEENEEEYPEQIIRKLRELCESGSVEVTNKLLSYFNIKYLAIESYNFPAVEGVMWQAYEIQCLSDKPYNLELRDA